jgi:hypothetical protein
MPGLAKSGLSKCYAAVFLFGNDRQLKQYKSIEKDQFYQKQSPKEKKIFSNKRQQL